MKIVGFSFEKISVEKKPIKVDKVKINTKIDISDIISVKSDIIKDNDNLINVKFSYEITYDPDYAKIEFIGNMILAIDEKKTKEILKKWEKKEMLDDFRTVTFNLILKKSSLRALQLEEELNLPLHIRLPTLKIEDKEQ